MSATAAVCKILQTLPIHTWNICCRDALYAFNFQPLLLWGNHDDTAPACCHIQSPNVWTSADSFALKLQNKQTNVCRRALTAPRPNASFHCWTSHRLNVGSFHLQLLFGFSCSINSVSCASLICRVVRFCCTSWKWNQPRGKLLWTLLTWWHARNKRVPSANRSVILMCGCVSKYLQVSARAAEAERERRKSASGRWVDGGICKIYWGRSASGSTGLQK